MLFNSPVFAIFLVISFCCYWLMHRSCLRLQNAFVLAASYVFYGWWDWRFLSLIIYSSLIDYFAGMLLGRLESRRARRFILAASLFTNLSLLGLFKYAGFFVDSLAVMLAELGLHADLPVLRLILPVGISFYTFQSLSYTIDVYKREMEPTKDLVAFLAFVSFFPQLVAGPIERASHLLPQFFRKRTFDPRGARDGLRQILWGLMKKVIVADNLAPYVENAFSNWQNTGSVTLVAGTVFFAFQIYCDFSGYSDIAVGTARLFGFSLMRNFAYPYFARNIAEFWRRWHISLSTWFRDYVFIPLGGSRGARARTILNAIVTFTVSGLWHGANWTFIAWGFLNGLYYLPSLVIRNRKSEAHAKRGQWTVPTLRDLPMILVTFTSTLVAWVFFRSQSLSASLGYLGRVFSGAPETAPLADFLTPTAAIITLVAVEWIQRGRRHGLDIAGLPVWARWAIYWICCAVLLLFANMGSRDFIYFQF